tara:strand:+ start:1212 stop:1364 length:153 start_codon:yes stop_codon:yes gene_type:complete
MADMSVEEFNNKLETTLDIIMEHFSETEDRITKIEDRVEKITNAIKEISG